MRLSIAIVQKPSSRFAIRRVGCGKKHSIIKSGYKNAIDDMGRRLRAEIHSECDQIVGHQINRIDEPQCVAQLKL